MSSLYYDYEFSKDWIGTFEATLQKIFFTVPNPIFGNGMWRIGIVAFGLLFPTYLNMRENNKPSKISRFLNLTFYILLLALIVSLGVLIRNGLEEGSCSLSLSSGSFIKTFELFVNNTLPCSIHSSAWILFTAGLALLLMRFSLGLLWKLIVRQDSPLLLWGASLLLAGYLGFQVLLVRDNQSYKYSDKVFFAALLTRLQEQRFRSE